jgi:hypothetical protein
MIQSVCTEAEAHRSVSPCCASWCSWQLITDAAPWERRANFNAEMTDNGAIILSSGYNDDGPGGRDNDLNDVSDAPPHTARIQSAVRQQAELPLSALLALLQLGIPGRRLDSRQRSGGCAAVLYLSVSDSAVCASACRCRC